MSPPRRKRAAVSWSTGKDSAWALHLIRQRPDVEITILLSALNATFQRVSMHGTARRLLELQAAAAGLPLLTVDLPSPCPNDTYERAMAAACTRLAGLGIEAIVFGDIFLDGVRAYRERQLAATGLEPLFPLWGYSTRLLAREMLAAGQRAIVTCLDPLILDPAAAGAEFGPAFLDALPPHADPCGENGEFHTFVFDSPAFSAPLRVRTGQTVSRDGFLFTDVLPEDGPSLTATMTGVRARSSVG